MVDELKLPSADALAIVACNLALQSLKLQDTNDLCGTFWFFYDLLTERNNAKKERNQKAECWEVMSPIILPLLLEAKKRGLKQYAFNTLLRAYRWEKLMKLPSDLNDYELMQMRGMGPVTLENVHSVFPGSQIPEELKAKRER